MGGKVKEKSLDWYEENKDEDGLIKSEEGYQFEPWMAKYCGSVFTVTESTSGGFGIILDGNRKVVFSPD